ncbi:uncharacterized protein Dvir_GJ22094 [Drosophila virilis]|uniref:MD-2-related lipid-recognition domain-containing protein n=1 Tax=Drosophila virilis TaxID=7244 RepID=B4LJ76_DROVI|nr:uncharacterized protein LOC6625686 [Drosophila virilis]EDW61512.2 uncharacterized protein Dvir_GJ22094 [Drosophila virilis]
MNLSVTITIQLILLRANLSWSWGYKYNVQIVQFDTLEPENELLVDFRNLRVVGRERSLNGTVHILEDMDGENFQLSVDFRNDPNNNGRWRAVLYNVPIMNICRAMKLYIGTYAKSTLRQGEITNLPFDGKSCPLPKGTYYVRNLLMNTETWPEIIPAGGVELNYRFYKHGKPVGGASCRAVIERKLM